MPEKYRVITLLGSTKFKDDFIEAQERLTLAGNIVLSVDLFEHADNKYEDIITRDVKQMLDDMCRCKIDMSDAIYVINRDDYIGESTISEIQYAIQRGKKVEFMFPHTQRVYSIMYTALI